MSRIFDLRSSRTFNQPVYWSWRRADDEAQRLAELREANPFTRPFGAERDKDFSVALVGERQK